jgi:uncharacterized membrane protein YfcA
MSSFFGIGGGTILVPLLMLMGLDIKEAIPISVVQMLFSSLFSTYLSFKNSFSALKNSLFIGLGGFLGALNSHFLIDNVQSFILEIIFLFFVSIAIYKFSKSEDTQKITHKRVENRFLLTLLGFFVGLIAISIGVGGSLILTPILVGYFFYDTKTASSIGLSFVIFSSLSGTISLGLADAIPYSMALSVAISSLLGVIIGLKIKNLVPLSHYRKTLLYMYVIIFFTTLYSIF